MVKFGTIKDYRRAQKLLTDAGYSITKVEGDLVKKTMVGNCEAVSIARMGQGWVFRYNSNFFKEAK